MAWSDTAPRPQRALIDGAYLDRLAQALGQRGLDELLADGMIELADRLATLGALARAADRAAVAALSHDIVAVAGHMGLGALSAAAAELNRATRDARDQRMDAGRLAELAAPVIALGTPSLDALAARPAGSGD
ncbi:MAG: hypothetical protein RQ752_11320 [Thermohalobaculum sp.]|nr:hypothetical protein [Thermohalobaculum sp.]